MKIPIISVNNRIAYLSRILVVIGAVLAYTPSCFFQAGWYQPSLETSWHWQLQGELRQIPEATLYNIDLFDNTPQAIASLKTRQHRVICYFSAGTWEPWRTDAQQFPRESIGQQLDAWQGEFWLDIRDPRVVTLMTKRMALARSKSCEGVEADNVDAYLYKEQAFNITAAEQLDYILTLTRTAHAMGMAFGLKNAPELADKLQQHADFAITERCQEQGNCHSYLGFIQAGKPVFNTEYAPQYHQPEARRALCLEARQLGIHTLVLPVGLDGSFRYACPP